jgi:predicted RNA-binding Zn-ribbon protein involved in translation (DUF1610 family)
MPWRRHYSTNCHACGRDREPDERFSARGKCPSCGVERSVANAEQLHEHNGPWFEKWRRAVAASVGAALLEDD